MSACFDGISDSFYLLDCFAMFYCISVFDLPVAVSARFFVSYFNWSSYEVVLCLFFEILFSVFVRFFVFDKEQ